MRNTRLEIRLLSGAGGAEISGVDVAQDLDDETIGEIRDALNEHCVVFFRDQELDVARHKAFARRFGEIFIHPNYVGMQATIPRSSWSAASPATRAMSARTGTPTPPCAPSRRWAPSSTASTCRPMAATPCSPTSTSPTRRCRTA